MRLLLDALFVLALMPLFVIGFPFYILPILVQRGRVSGTAYEPFNARLIYHITGRRPDAAAWQLAGGLPATSSAVFRTLGLQPFAWTSQLTGYVPSFVEYPPPRPITLGAMIGARCEFLDHAIAEADEIRQFVILGAGWDTRAYGLLARPDVKVFEVDARATQAVKRAALDKTGIDASRVTFVCCDFNRQSWIDALTEQGFDPDQPTFILWEGVSMYLEEQAVQSTLRAVADLPRGSRIAFDFLSRELLFDSFTGKLLRLTVQLFYGEPFLFGFPVRPDFSTALGTYLEQQGLTLERNLAWGAKSGRKAPFGGMATAVRADGPVAKPG